MREKETNDVVADFQDKLKKELEKRKKEAKKKADPKEKDFWDHIQQ